uniref:Endoplasmic reticulum vesicle transporter C-terminal domain-containing protein n=1 Tax=Ditylenchus dipsaci TaxID=166011 RepID=A0A915EA13_9BILA
MDWEFFKLSLVSLSGGGGKEIDEGSACRINGKVPVIKGNGDRLTISVGKSMNIGNIMAHLGAQIVVNGNISHRIERFHFGPHVWGLVSPLAGHEQISDKATEYRYYIKVVPTKIYKAGLFSRPTMAYQYAVTYSKKEAKDGEHIHDSIVFDYEFTSIVIEVRPRVISFLQLLLRICSLIGGVFATSSFLEAFLSRINIFSRFSKVQPIFTEDSKRRICWDCRVSCVFPIDLVKTRLQNQRVSPDDSVQYKGILDCARQTWKNGGATTFSKFRSLYSGSAVNILLITPEKAIKLVANDLFRHRLAKPGEKQLSTVRGMIAGGCAGFCQVIITTPMELLKIQCQQATGLYKGIGSTVARDVTFSVIYFPLFAKLNSLGPRTSDGSGDAVFYASLISGIAAGATASFCVTPLDVIKTRIQLIGGKSSEAYSSMPDAFVKILRNEGPKALFKGAACRMMVMAPLFGIAQMVYFIGIAEWFLGIKKIQHV